MFATRHAIRILIAAASTCVLSDGARAQSLELGPVTVHYPGIGPLTWLPAPGIKANLVVPNITAGARVTCFQASYKCDINVQRRDLAYFSRQPADLIDEVKGQFKSGSPLNIISTPQSVEAVFIDRATNAKYPYTSVALVFRGPALLRVVAQGPDSASVAAMVNMARSVRPAAAREMMAQNFSQFVAVCNTRMPQTSAANERALATSSFSDAGMFAIARLRDPSMTLEQVRAARAMPDAQQLASYDRLSPTARTTFCNSLPGIIAAGTRELRTM